VRRTTAREKRRPGETKAAMKIADLFFSIQGEGRLLGVPSAFVRTTGCPLRCCWCDSDYTSWHPQGEELSVDAILDRLLEYPVRHIVVTGGEPLIAPGMEELCRRLRERGYHLTLETAGVVFKPVACDLVSLSPKLSNSIPHLREGGRWARRHDRLRLRLDVLQAFIKHSDYQLKFVIDHARDVEEVRAIVARLEDVEPAKVLLMPQGTDREELRQRATWLVEVCKEYGYRFCPRLHIDLYGNRRGT
jgi:7-carboxy-7-deazaguanine synthase